MRSGLLVAMGMGALLLCGVSGVAQAGCGCEKPPPPQALVRPFVGHAGERIVLFSDQLHEGDHYQVEFASLTSGVTDWSNGRARRLRDLADGRSRPQLRVVVPDVPFGPVRITVFGRAGQILQLADSEFTVTGKAINLHDFSETITRAGYRAGVGRDGTLYIPVDVSEVTDATSFVAQGEGLGLSFKPQDVSMYNEQGFLMQTLGATNQDWFDIARGAAGDSDAVAYWRHEFRTYKREHRQVRDRGLADDNDWHEDGTRHVDHDHIVVAIRGAFANGARPAPGSTPPFTLVVSSTPDPR